MASFQNGDEEAFNQIVARFKDPLVNFVYRFLGNYDDCVDVVQETFVRVFRKRDRYQPIAKFSTWIYTIAGNLAKTELRRRSIRNWVSLSQLRAVPGQDIDIPDDRYSPEKGAESALKEEIIQKALLAIPRKYREVVVLRDIQELSYEEISKITGLSLGTVKSRINRGRTQLQVLLKDIYNV
ncbi:MAG TPA: sigma-70 family RNA polymerase sigma factor [Bacteroidota bacterium]